MSEAGPRRELLPRTDPGELGGARESSEKRVDRSLEQSLMNDATGADIVGALLVARARRAPVANDAVTPAMSLSLAYDQQGAHLRAVLWGVPGGRVIGYKVGATTLAAQRHFGLDGPFFAPILSCQASASPARLSAADFFHRIIEVELAFRLNQELRPKPGATSIPRVSILKAVASVIPAIEIADSRFASWTTAPGTAAIADLGFSGHWVHGTERTDWQDLNLRGVTAALAINGETVRTGCGADVLGDPLRAVELLSLHLRARGQVLRAGDVITTGSMTGSVAVSGPAKIMAKIEGFEAVEVELK
jgi:2-keto-4-pentenoate hydratase